MIHVRSCAKRVQNVVLFRQSLLISKLSLQSSTVVEAMDAHSAPTVLRTSVITIIVREFSGGTVNQVIEEATTIDGETVDRPVSAGNFRPTVDVENPSLNGTLDGSILFELMTLGDEQRFG